MHKGCFRQGSELPELCGYPIKEYVLRSNLSIGDCISFGPYEWRVLALGVNAALLTTRDIIELRRFDTSSNNWRRSEIKAWLNGEFIIRFDVASQNAILSKSGVEVLLLSTEEASYYFRNNDDRIAYCNGEAHWWWLRSPGINSNGVDVVGDDDGVCPGNYVNCDNYGVRPALWLNLTSGIF
jgi:hypothetical protein